MATGFQIILEHIRDMSSIIPQKLGLQPVEKKLFRFLLDLRKIERKNWKNMLEIKQKERDLQDITNCLTLKSLILEYIKALKDEIE